MLHLSAPAIMFVITVSVAGILIIPATSYSPKDKVTGFYWRGVWVFLSALFSFSGAQQILKMLNIPAQASGDVFIQALLLTFVIFVVFAWFRLAGKAALLGVQTFFKKVRRA